VNKQSILVIEDEKNIGSYIETILTGKDYKVLRAGNGMTGLSVFASHHPDVILLDLGLPDIDGMEVLKRIREVSDIPVIVISARTQEQEKVNALDKGADDYLTKPFGSEELMARIRTALRHHNRANASQQQSAVYSRDGLEIDFERRSVILEGQPIHLTQIEYKLVSLLAQNAGKVLTYDYILKEIWGPFADTDNQILRVNMANIRRKLETNPAEPHYIYTEIGVGYRMLENAAAES
jgi:two-component system KDP operon response regulator KdpE